jgi:hypothetical protein
MRKFFDAQAAPIIGRSISRQAAFALAGKLIHECVWGSLCLAEHVRAHFADQAAIHDRKNISLKDCPTNQIVNPFGSLPLNHEIVNT